MNIEKQERQFKESKKEAKEANMERSVQQEIEMFLIGLRHQVGLIVQLVKAKMSHLKVRIIFICLYLKVMVMHLYIKD